MRHILIRRGIENYFAFDMSVPDSLHYFAAGLNTFTRRSEFEGPSVLEVRAQGVWLDSFEGASISKGAIQSCLDSVRAVAIVSPELHGRPHADAWRDWQPLLVRSGIAARVLLCTDFPEEADIAFNRIAGFTS